MLSRGIFSTFVALLAPLSVSAAASNPTQVTVWTWPLSAPSPLPLAKVTFSNNPNDDITPTVSDYTPPDIPFKQDDYVRVGLYDPKTSQWQGSVTSAASFNPNNRHRLSLHVDKSGQPYHVDFAAFYQPLDPREERRRQRRAEREAAKPKKTKPTKGKKKGKDTSDEEFAQPVLEIVRQLAGPAPHLNAPVEVGADGKVDGEAEPEKSFLQKYWYLIAIFLVVQLVAAGGGSSGEGK